MDMKIPGSREILEFHDNWLAQPDWDAESPAAQAQGVWSQIEHNHRCNCRLWKEEDQARRRNVPDSAIAANKRNIDAVNQQRNDSIEKMDECLLAELAEVELNAAVRLHSESAGSMIDPSFHPRPQGFPHADSDRAFRRPSSAHRNQPHAIRSAGRATDRPGRLFRRPARRLPGRPRTVQGVSAVQDV